MSKSFEQIIQGYKKFREKYVLQDNVLLKRLAEHGQSPQILVVACCDSRVDPALLLQCEPGDLFIVRNVANIIPPYENNEAHHGTSAAIEFAVRHLGIQHLIILGHSQCGGIQASLNNDALKHDDFIGHWVNLIKIENTPSNCVNDCAKSSLMNSYDNALSYPWIKQGLEQNKLKIHLWFFDIKDGLIHSYQHDQSTFVPLAIELS